MESVLKMVTCKNEKEMWG